MYRYVFRKKSKLIVFPELSITSYTCGELFSQNLLISKAIDGIHDICKYSIDKDILIAIGAPLLYKNSLYNCAVIIFDGKY